MNRLLLIFLLCVFLSTGTNAEPVIIDVYGKVCNHGLNKPPAGDFSVFVFCDDGLGTNIGIILDRPGGGPVTGCRDGSYCNPQWSIGDRFWQQGFVEGAMNDVLQIVWSGSGNYLYVSTGEVYSDYSLYELDLVNRKIVKLFDGNLRKESPEIKSIMDNKLIINNGQSFTIRE